MSSPVSLRAFGVKYALLIWVYIVSRKGEVCMSKRSVRQYGQNRRTRRKSQVWVIVGIVVAAIAVVGLLIWIGTANNPVAKVDTSRYQGIPQEVDRTGAYGLALGKQDARATVVEYADFSCPHCRDMADTMHRIIDTYVRDGRLRIIYKPITILDPAYSTSAARAAICGEEQGKGWEMHDQIWGVFDANSPGAYTLDVFAVRAGALGLDTAKFRACFNSSGTTTAINDLEQERQRLAVDSTPTIYLNGQVLNLSAVSLETSIQAAVGG